MAADSHIRSTSADVRAAIDQGIRASATFHQMAQSVEASDSIVFFAEGSCGGARRACLIDVTTAGQRRILWVIVNLRLEPSQRDLVASIGHELRHTLEVISEPSIRSIGEQFGLYTRIGIRLPGGGFETVAAIDAESRIRDEVKKFEQQRESK